MVNKTRPGRDIAASGELIGEVCGRTAIIGDDMIGTGGTLIAATQALLEAGRRTWSRSPPAGSFRATRSSG